MPTLRSPPTIPLGTDAPSSSQRRPFSARQTGVRIMGPSARQIARTDFAALRLCRPSASIRVAPGVAPVATRQSIKRDRLRSNVRRTYTFPSAKCASASENTEATGDPLRPLARLSAPPGQGRLAPPHRTGRCVRSGRDGRAPSGERRADAMRRRSATRFGGKVAEGNRVATRKRPRSPHAPQMTRQSVASSQAPTASRGGSMRGSSNEIRSFIF